jgi:hypothetical protein
VARTADKFQSDGNAATASAELYQCCATSGDRLHSAADKAPSRTPAVPASQSLHRQYACRASSVGYRSHYRRKCSRTHSRCHR